jgi:purine nucleosidase
MVRIHLDTDAGSDTDDLCALAMLLGWPDVEVAGVTTVSDPGGIRAGFVHHALQLAGRADVPVAAGAEGSLGGFFVPLEFPNCWPEPIAPRPSNPGDALGLIDASVRAGATVVAIGPYTNLALFEAERPGRLGEVPVVVMGGWVTPPRPGLPRWTSEQDFNVQQDAFAAKVVFERSSPLVVQVAATLEVTLRRRDIPALQDAGPLAQLLASQALFRGREYGMESLPKEYPGLPDDLLNFQYDPLACAVACGWDGVKIEEYPIVPELARDRLRLRIDPEGRALRVVTEVDGERFARDWLAAVVRASGTNAGPSTDAPAAES